MRRSPVLFAFWFLPLAALAGAGLGCAAYRYQHPVTSAHGGAVKASSAVGVVPPRLRAEVNAAKEDLARDGKYACCIKPSCDYCLLHEGKCSCREVVEMMGPGCGECTQGWIEGRGAVPGVDVWKFLDERVKAHRQDSTSSGSVPPR